MELLVKIIFAGTGNNSENFLIFIIFLNIFWASVFIYIARKIANAISSKRNQILEETTKEAERENQFE